MFYSFIIQCIIYSLSFNFSRQLVVSIKIYNIVTRWKDLQDERFRLRVRAHSNEEYLNTVYLKVDFRVRVQVIYYSNRTWKRYISRSLVSVYVHR